MAAIATIAYVATLRPNVSITTEASLRCRRDGGRTRSKWPRRGQRQSNKRRGSVGHEPWLRSPTVFARHGATSHPQIFPTVHLSCFASVRTLSRVVASTLEGAGRRT